MNSVSKFKNFFTEQKEKGNRLIVPKNQDENFYFYKPVEETFKNAEIIEESNSKLKIKDVARKSENSKFSYFLDGIERKKICYLNNIPVIYGYTAAVIMGRTDKKMHSTEFEIFDENLYLPVKENGDEPGFYFNIKDLNKLQIKFTNIGIIDKKGKRKDYPRFPSEIEQMAHSAIQTSRGTMEKMLVSKWLKKQNTEWLFIDGRLEPVSKFLSSASNIAGIIKSHKVHYFTPYEQFDINSMKKGQRSSIFKPEDENVFSWYLRIHNPSSSGAVDFGIIRIEIPAKQELLAKVDEISSWILLETNPVAFPASRWDRMIYPIKYCEDYLKSKAPSYSMINSLFM